MAGVEELDKGYTEIMVAYWADIWVLPASAQRSSKHAPGHDREGEKGRRHSSGLSGMEKGRRCQIEKRGPFSPLVGSEVPLGPSGTLAGLSSKERHSNVVEL